MARRHNTRRSESAPGWVWMLFGLGVGLAVAIGVYLRAPFGGETAAPAATVARPTGASSASAAAQRPAEAAPRPQRTPAAERRFDFYEILPQFEVEIPDDTGSAAPAARPRPATAAAPGSFLVQAGSFSAAADADRLQASLALLGFESHVQRVTIEDDVFNRVRIGPIGDLDAARRIQRKLRDAGIDPLLMKVPN